MTFDFPYALVSFPEIFRAYIGISDDYRNLESRPFILFLIVDLSNPITIIPSPSQSAIMVIAWLLGMHGH